jgi:ABC-type lipoprotein export system ATPase subunit
MRGGLSCHALQRFRRGVDGTERPVIDGVDADFPAGEISLIVGPTGAGKSTLLHLLAGLLRPTAGEVRADGEPVSRWVTAHRDRWRRRVGVLFQTPSLVPDLTVLENVMLPLIPRGRSLSDIRRRAGGCLERAGMSHLAGQPAAILSGGEGQRAALARALAVDPRFLIADEPTAHQDDEGAAIVMAALRAERDRGAAVVVAGHDHRLLAAGVADRRYRLASGRLASLP